MPAALHHSIPVSPSLKVKVTDAKPTSLIANVLAVAGNIHQQLYSVNVSIIIQAASENSRFIVGVQGLVHAVSVTEQLVQLFDGNGRIRTASVSEYLPQ
jgi:hypothetical protein